jgi:hypothetical protein
MTGVEFWRIIRQIRSNMDTLACVYHREAVGTGENVIVGLEGDAYLVRLDQGYAPWIFPWNGNLLGIGGFAGDAREVPGYPQRGKALRAVAAAAAA